MADAATCPVRAAYLAGYKAAWRDANAANAELLRVIVQLLNEPLAAGREAELIEVIAAGATRDEMLGALLLGTAAPPSPDGFH